MKRLALSILLLVLACSVFASEDYSVQWKDKEQKDADFLTRYNVSLSYKPVKKVSLGFDVEARLNKNSSQFDKLLIGANIDYKPIKYLKFSLGYIFIPQYRHERKLYENGATVERYDEKLLVDYWDLRHRVNFSATGAVPIGRFTLSLRERVRLTTRQDSITFENKKYALYDSREVYAIEYMLRSRLMLEYDFFARPVELYLSGEVYTPLQVSKYAKINKPADAYFNYISEFNAKLGVKWRVDAFSTIEVCYMYFIDMENDVNVKPNKELVVVTPKMQMSHGIYIGYNYRF